ncbi:efflux RND transporter permease subunit [Reichenbachiella agarivorans]|uniref:Efflux RND transporter permease subunit n=1 Tax=Reichenbachiella agarivorans TaxID=2979464 RepID=A0ABY6CU84_9BACT|nr:efflux RND transporter permease subunit [Reichenbachiella agarivorans]UXP33449.1 efflux RND transporter permease subunit [Reichenbachiella agarivorans]
MNIAEFSIKRPSFILVIFILTSLAGLLTYNKIGYELIPEMDIPVMTITTIYPGAAPSEVESSVSKKIEDAISELDNLDEINSKSLESASIVIVNFKSGTDLDLMVQDAQRQINNILAELPEDAEAPSISKISPNDMPILQISATSNLDGKYFYAQMDDKLIPELQQLKGVATIQVIGGDQRSINVSVDPEKLHYYNLSLLQVTRAISYANLDFPTGKVKSNGQAVTVRISGKFTKIDEIRELIVATTDDGGVIRLKDIATITDDIAETESIARLNGKNAILLRIKKQGDANTVEVSESVLNKLKELEERYSSQELNFAIAQNDADFTLEAVDAVLHDLEIAIILVAAVMLLFLHSFRNALIVMIAVPASLLATVAFMFMMGYTFNLMTLLAMSLVIGILVDDSIVVLENIYRHMEMGKKPMKAAIDGIAEIGLTALSITLVIVIVFIPVTMVNSFIADMFRQFSWTIVVATLFSLLVSFTLIPWLMSRFSQVTHLNPKNPFQWFLIQFEKALKGLNDLYSSSLHWFMDKKWVLFAILLVLFGFTGWIGSLGIIGSETFASGDKGEFKLSLEYSKTTSIEANNLHTREIENWIASKPEVKMILTNVGGPTSGMGSTGLGDPYKAEMNVMIDQENYKNLQTEPFMIDIMNQIRQNSSGVKVGASKVGMTGTGSAPIEVSVVGENYDEVIETANKLKNIIEHTPGANDLKVSVEAGVPEVQINIDRDKLSRLGLDVATVGATLQNSLQGNDDNEFSEEGLEYPIMVRLTKFDRKNANDVEQIPFINSKDELVTLNQFAAVTQTTAPSMLERKNRLSSVTVTGYTLGVPAGTVTQNIMAQMEKENFPAGINFIWGGDVKNQKESFGPLGGAFGISLLLIYFILVALYDNFAYPLVVLLSVPVAIIGAMLALGLSLSSMSIFTILGMIMLLGLVAKNAILIVDFAIKLKADGLSTREAVMQAGNDRLRPILMTTIAMVIAMIPIAIASGAGAEWKNAMAWVLIGGLMSSLCLTIYLVPVAFELVDKATEWIQSKFKKDPIRSVDSVEHA